MDKNSLHKKILGPLVVGLVLLTKSSKLITAMKLIKFGKPLVTAISMLFSTIVYAIAISPWSAVGIVAMLFIHEMGHIIAMRIKGLETNGPVFIPFLGAAIFTPANLDRDTEAFMAIGGPVLGTIGALSCFTLWLALGRTSEIVLIVSYFGLCLNLFNMIPVSPMDGGRITQAVGDWFKYIGAAILISLTIILESPDLILVWILTLEYFEVLAPHKTKLSIILTIIMSVIMIHGYTGNEFWQIVLDITIATAFTGIHIVTDYQKIKADRLIAHMFDFEQRVTHVQGMFQPAGQQITTPATVGEVMQHIATPSHDATPTATPAAPQLRPPLPLRGKVVWLARYVGLLSILIVATAIEMQYLPHKTHHTQSTQH